MKIDKLPLTAYQLHATPDDLQLISDCAQVHYDSVCKQAARPPTAGVMGGFVWSWLMHTTWDVDNGHTSTPCNATPHELDTVAKILEMAPYLDVDQAKKGRELSQAIHTAWHAPLKTEREKQLETAAAALLLELNTRGELNPGGCDANTPVATAYAALKALL